MTVIIVDNSNEAVEKMAVDETSSDNSYVKTPPQIRRKKKKRPTKPIMGTTFADLYKLTGETLGEGSYGKVDTCKNVFTGIEYAVKTIEKRPGTFNRSKVLKEIEIYHLCRGMKNIIQLIEFFEEADYFYLVFEKIEGGPLLKQIQQRVCFSESSAVQFQGGRGSGEQGFQHQPNRGQEIVIGTHCQVFPDRHSGAATQVQSLTAQSFLVQPFATPAKEQRQVLKIFLHRRIGERFFHEKYLLVRKIELLLFDNKNDCLLLSFLYYL